MVALTSSLRRGGRALPASPQLRLAALPLSVAGALFWIAFDGGSYATTAWTSTAIVVWWAIMLLVLFDVAPTERLLSNTGLVAALLAGYTTLALVSLTWSAGEERAVIAFTRDALYTGVFLLVVFLSSRSALALWTDGLALAVAAVAVVALTSRLFPGVFGLRGLPESLPAAGARLSYPLDYWNGLGIFLGIGAPLLLRTAASSARPLALRAAATAALPLVATAVYLTSSRGAVVTAAVGVLLLVTLSASWSPLAATLVGAAGSVLAIAAVQGQDALLAQSIGSAAARSQGHRTALVLAAIALVTGAGFALGSRLLRGRRRPGSAVGRALAAVAAVGAVVAALAAHPLRQLDEFKALPSRGGATVIDTHLVSGSGSGRWQFWTAAVDEFRSAPALGRGAGSFETWWTQHASFSYFIRSAHSLYLQTLGELGVVGLLLLLGAFGTAIAIAVTALGRSRGEERLAVAAVLAASAAFLVGAGIDWMWELPAVAVLGLACLALAAGPAVDRPRLEPVTTADAASRRGSVAGRFGLGLAVLAAGWLVLAAEASSLLSSSQLHHSQSLAARSDFRGALAAAKGAHQIAPWSAQPLVQIALVREQVDELDLAHAAIVDAIARDRLDWRLWLIRSRIESERGDTLAARASYERARGLDPLSPIFRS